MPAQLETSDAHRLLAALPRRWPHRIAGWMTFVSGLVVIVALAARAPALGCAPADPCGPDPIDAIGIGLTLSALLLGWTAPWLAAGCAIGAAGTAIWSGLLDPANVHTPADWLQIGYPLLVVACAAFATRLARPAAPEWSSRVVAATPPQPADGWPKARPGRIRLAGGVLLAVAALGVSGFGIAQQLAADQQQRAAEIVTGVVVAHLDGFTLKVDLPGVDPRTVDVLDVVNYPVGSELALAVDGAGLQQPLAEPYDASGWHAVAIMLGAVGAALWWRGRQRRQVWRQALDAPAPIHAVFINSNRDLFAGDARQYEGSIASVQLLEQLPTARLSAGWATAGMPKWPSSTATPALPVYPYSLYGVPVIGGICALVDEGEQVIMLVRLKPADSRLVFPATRPVGSLGSAADEAPSPPGAVEPARRPPIRAAELALVPPAEVTAAPETVHQHRKSRLIGYALTLAMPLAVVELVRRAPLPAAWAISITAAVVACATGWRLLRSGVRWNAGGVAATGIWTSVAAAWPQIGAITVDDDMVNIADTSGQMATITAQRRRGGRTAQSLRAGLEHARSRYTPGVPQPGLQRAPRPWALILVAPLPVAVLMAFHLLSQV